MSMLFAATYPQRTVALILFGTTACSRRAADYPYGGDEAFAELYRLVDDGWGTGESLKVFGRSLLGDERTREFLVAWSERPVVRARFGPCLTH